MTEFPVYRVVCRRIEMIAPPTDSLYKFAAIVGLVMVLWGVAFPWNKSHELRIEVAELKALGDETRMKGDRLRDEFEMLSGKLEAILESDGDKSEIQDIREQKREVYIKLLETVHPFDSRLERIKVLQDVIETYRIVGWSSVIVGTVFMVFGFITWYFRVQQYLDRDLKKGLSRSKS